MSRFECDLYPEQRFRCLCCSFGCCDRFEIPVSPEEARAIDALHIPGAPSFDDCFRPGIMNAGLVIAKDAQHHCVFADGRLCAIHKHHGFAAKPLACRIFPLNIQSWADGRVSAELRFICPSAGSADGKRTGDMLDEIAIYSRQLAGLGGRNDCIYSHANPAPLAAVRSVHGAFRALLHEEEKPLAFRLYAAARILDFHARPDMAGAVRTAGESFRSDLREFVGKAAKELENELASGRCDALIRAEFRNLICAYLRDDDPFDRSAAKRLRRGWRHFRAYSGFGLMSELNAEAPNCSMRGLPEATHGLSCEPAALDPFRQFFYGKLDSMHFCGSRIHHFDYETGFAHLLLSVPVAFTLASAYALAAGKDVIGREAMQRTIRLLDLTFGRSPFFRMRVARRWIRHLARPGRYAGLLNTLPSLSS